MVLTGSQVAAGLDEAEITIVDFDALQGWDEDDHLSALRVFSETCTLLKEPQWAPLCALASVYKGPARKFFEVFFRPVLIEDGKPGLFTAYFEPELNGARRKGGRYQYPIYRRPPEVTTGVRWLTRREIVEQGALEGRGLEIAWVDDPVKLQFLQIQGSGRIRLTDGSVIRVGYAGSNGQPYRSLGDELVRRRIYKPHQVSAAVIGSWVRRNPEKGAELLLHNSSFVFFRELPSLSANRGPIGAMNRSITAQRSIAVDPAFVPLGAPVWIEKQGQTPINRLMIAQDTGSRIKGAQRADIFIGTGDRAGTEAGRIRDKGQMYVLLPIQSAYALKPEG